MRSICISCVVMLSVFLSGCVSSYVAYKTNNEHVERAISAKMKGNTPFIGIDLMSISTAYLAAWQEHPVKMTGATLVDIGIGYALYAAGQEAEKDKSRSVEAVVEPAPAVQPTTVSGQFVIIGDGNNIDYSREEIAGP